MPNVHSRQDLSAHERWALDRRFDSLAHRPDSRVLQAFAGGAFFAAGAQHGSPAGLAMALSGGLLLWLAATQGGRREGRLGAELPEPPPHRARDAAPPVT